MGAEFLLGPPTPPPLNRPWRQALEWHHTSECTPRENPGYTDVTTAVY